MNRRTIVRGIQLIVVITLLSFGVVVYRSIESQGTDLRDTLANVKPLWLLVAAALALQEGVCGGLRIWVLGRVLSPKMRVRTGIISEFVLMFCAGVTPGQAGAAPSQIAVLMNDGMRFAEVGTAEMLTAACTATFFLVSAVIVFVLRRAGLLVVPNGGAELDALLGLSVVVFGSSLVGMALAAAYPPLLKGLLRAAARVGAPTFRGALRLLVRVPGLTAFARRHLEHPGAVLAGTLRGVDDLHAGFRVYAKRGKLAYLTAQLLTFAFFCSRFAVPYFILLGLGMPTEPRTFVGVGPPIVQIIAVQALLNFALYLSPTPGASGIAEAGSTSLMQPWVYGAYELPYLVLWRLLALFLCMFVGGAYVFRYLGTDVLEKRVKDVEDEKRAIEAERDRPEGAAAPAADTPSMPVVTDEAPGPPGAA